MLVLTFFVITQGQQKEWLANLTINDLHLSSSEEVAVLHQAQAAVVKKNLSPVEVIVGHQDGGEDIIINSTLQELGFEYSLHEDLFEEGDLERITPFFGEHTEPAPVPEVAQLAVNHDKWDSFLDQLDQRISYGVHAAALAWDNGEWSFQEGRSGRRLDRESAERSFERFMIGLQRGVNPHTLRLQSLIVFAETEGNEAALSEQFTQLQHLLRKPVHVQLQDEVHTFDLSEDPSFLVLEEGSAHINRDRLLEQVMTLAEEFYRETNTIRIVGQEEVRYNAFKAITEGEFVEGRRVNPEELTDQIIAAVEGEASEEEGEEFIKVYGKVYEMPLKVYSEIDNMEYDLISVGYSEYSQGNAANRVHNIETGLNRINGSLIAPGEKISFNRMNGPIDNDFRTGYAISGANAIPSLGGGICQVSTTFYRALLNAGTPITMRQNHSWDLSYYRAGGYGLDATIYPSVGLDVKAVNDYDSHLFFYAYDRPETEEAFVLVYGKADGRKVQLEPEEEYVPFYGAKTLKWTQTITKPDGEVILNDIVSRYRM